MLLTVTSAYISPWTRRLQLLNFRILKRSPFLAHFLEWFYLRISDSCHLSNCCWLVAILAVDSILRSRKVDWCIVQSCFGEILSLVWRYLRLLRTTETKSVTWWSLWCRSRYALTRISALALNFTRFPPQCFLYNRLAVQGGPNTPLSGCWHP